MTQNRILLLIGGLVAGLFGFLVISAFAAVNYPARLELDRIERSGSKADFYYKLSGFSRFESAGLYVKGQNESDSSFRLLPLRAEAADAHIKFSGLNLDLLPATLERCYREDEGVYVFKANIVVKSINSIHRIVARDISAASEPVTVKVEEVTAVDPQDKDCETPPPSENEEENIENA